MRQDLATLKNEIEKLLTAGKWIVFRGQARLRDGMLPVFWDIDTYPDPKPFLDIAAGLGVKLVVFHHREFTRDEVEEALEKLDNAMLAADDRREFERNIKKMKAYEGFTCTIELSFEYEQRTYVYEAGTRWYDDFIDMMDSLDASMDFDGIEAEEDDEDDSRPPNSGPFFSHN